MKILKPYDDKRDLPKYFPTELLNEEDAKLVYSQTLSRLDERGGMSPEEIYCNIKGLNVLNYKWSDETKQDVANWIKKQIAWHESRTTG